jgi:hypothetical protein
MPRPPRVWREFCAARTGACLTYVLATLCYYAGVLEKAGTDESEVIRGCASRIIRSGALGRSQVLARLLGYLVECALRGEVPKEFDISVDVFGKDRANVDTTDAQTRVAIYKLRARLDVYYAGEGKQDPIRLVVPKGGYHLLAVANEAVTERAAGLVDRPRFAVRAGLTLLAASLVASVIFVLTYSGTVQDDRALLNNPVWSGLIGSGRPVLVVVGDHFFFGVGDSRVRIRDVEINSKEELLGSTHYGSDATLIYETLTYLPKSVVFGMQTILPRAHATGQSVSLKLVSELTSDDLRDFDVIYVGFVRAMGILKDYYFARSNFAPESPMFLTLTRMASGEVFARSGPVPHHNTDYGLFARFVGPAGNELIVFSGIGDVGVLAAVRSLSSDTGLVHIEALLQSQSLDVSRGFEVLVEAAGHSRTNLDFRIVGAYALTGDADRAARATGCCPGQQLPGSASVETVLGSTDH